MTLAHTSNANRPIDPPDLRLFKPTRMCDESYVYTPTFSQETRHILAPEAVTYAADAADIEVGLDVIEREIENALDLSWGVAREPLCKVEGGAFAVVDGDGIAGEKVGDDDGVSGAGDGVGEAGRVSRWENGGLKVECMRWAWLARCVWIL